MSACVFLAPTGRDTGQHQLPEASSSTVPPSPGSPSPQTHSLTLSLLYFRLCTPRLDVNPTPSFRLSQKAVKPCPAYHPSLNGTPYTGLPAYYLVACSRPLLISRSAHILLSDLKHTTILPLPPSPRGKQDAFLLWLLQIPICYFVCF